jgi:hypothetical protein
MSSEQVLPAMRERRPKVPVWLMGLTLSGFGVYGAISVITIQQMLAIRQVSESDRANILTLTLLPASLSFLLSPVLDIGLSRRGYAVLLLIVTAVLQAAAFEAMDNLPVLTVLLTAGSLSAYLYQTAVSGWFSAVISSREERALGAWMTIGINATWGVFAVLGGEFTQSLPPSFAAGLLSLAVLLPILVFPWIPSPPLTIPWTLKGFISFGRDIRALLRMPVMIFAIVMFLSPTSTFSLTDYLPSHGADFHASESYASRTAGITALLGALLGPLLFGLTSSHFRLAVMYLLVGLVGGVITVASCLAGSTPQAFAGALLLQNTFLNMALAAFLAFSLTIVGRDNPISATAFGLLWATSNLPVSYMVKVDSWGYQWSGTTGMFIYDGGLTVVSCVAFFGVLQYLARRRSIRL